MTPKSYGSKLEEAKDIVINSIAETMDLYGVNRSVGNLYGTMLFEDDMTLDEMREDLQMSKPSMSSGVKKLQEYNIVKQRFTRGSRKQHFEAEKNFFEFFSNFFTQKWNREIRINMEGLKESEALINQIIEANDVEDDIKEEALKIKEDMKHWRVYYKWLETISNAVKSGEIYKYFPIPEMEKRD